MKQMAITIVFTFISVICLAQNTTPKYEIHETPETKIFNVHSLNKIKLGSCYNGVFAVFDEVYSKNYIFSKAGQLLGEVQSYELIHFFDGEYAKNKIFKGDHYAAPIIKTDGSVINDTGAYHIQISDVQNGAFLLHKDEKLFFVDLKNNIKHTVSTKRSDDDATVFGPGIDGRHLYKNRFGKYGYISENGTLSIPAQFESAYDFSEGVAAVYDDNTGLWGYIDVNGTYVIPPTFSNPVSSFHDGYGVVCKKNSARVYINKSGEQVSPEYSYALDFCDGYAWTWESNKAIVSIIDTSFNAVKGLSDYEISWYSVRGYSRLVSVNTYLRNTHGGSYNQIYTINGDLLLSQKFPNSLNLAGELIEYIICEGYSTNTIKERGYINENGEVIIKFIKSEF